MNKNFLTVPRIQGKKKDMYAFNGRENDLSANAATQTFKPFQPSDLPSIAFWFRSDYGISGDTASNVAAWLDYSGNGRHLMQGTTANRPAYISNEGISEYPYLSFDGSNDTLKTVPFTYNQPYTNYIVYKKRNTKNNVYYVYDGNATNGMALRTGTEPLVILLSASAGPVVNANSLNFNIDCGVFNGTSSTHRNNNDVEVTGNPGANNAGGLTLGGVGAQNSNFAPVDVFELIGYSVAHGDLEKSLVRKYLNNKYNIY